MILEDWAGYVPSPGSRYRVHYVPDNHGAEPDLSIIGRTLDARPGVALKSVAAEGSRGVVADLVIYLGDAPLLSALGTYVSDGAEFWSVAGVERTDDGVPSGAGVTLGRLLDAALDPFQDATSAARTAVTETAQAVRRVGIPTGLIIGAAIVGFFLARR